MKKLLFMAALATAACTAKAQDTLTIIEQDYVLARETAKQQHKLLIVDFYTTWCVPCKVLDKTIFRNDSMAREIAREYIVLKYDAERDSVHNLSLKHHVSSYPTTIVLTAEGRVVHKMFGTGGKASLVDNYTRLLGESLQLHRKQQYLEGYAAAIDPDLYPAFYKKYVRRTADLRPDDLARFWKEHQDPASEEGFAILAYFGRAPQGVVDAFIRNRASYEQRFGKADVRFVMTNITGERFMKAVAEKDEKQYEAAVSFAQQQLSPEEAANYAGAYRVEMDMAMGKWDQVIEMMEAQGLKKTLDEGKMNYYCWKIYEQCSEPGTLTKKAVQLMRPYMNSQTSFATWDTYARLLFKSGNKEAAATAMKQAIAKGKAEGADTRESEEVLQQFNQ